MDLNQIKKINEPNRIEKEKQLVNNIAQTYLNNLSLEGLKNLKQLIEQGIVDKEETNSKYR